MSAGARARGGRRPPPPCPSSLTLVDARERARPQLFYERRPQLGPVDLPERVLAAPRQVGLVGGRGATRAAPAARARPRPRVGRRLGAAPAQQALGPGPVSATGRGGRRRAARQRGRDERGGRAGVVPAVDGQALGGFKRRQRGAGRWRGRHGRRRCGRRRGGGRAAAPGARRPRARRPTPAPAPARRRRRRPRRHPEQGRRRSRQPPTPTLPVCRIALRLEQPPHAQNRVDERVRRAPQGGIVPQPAGAAAEEGDVEVAHKDDGGARLLLQQFQGPTGEARRGRAQGGDAAGGRKGEVVHGVGQALGEGGGRGRRGRRGRGGFALAARRHRRARPRAFERDRGRVLSGSQQGGEAGREPGLGLELVVVDGGRGRVGRAWRLRGPPAAAASPATTLVPNTPRAPGRGRPAARLVRVRRRRRHGLAARRRGALGRRRAAGGGQENEQPVAHEFGALLGPGSRHSLD